MIKKLSLYLLVISIAWLPVQVTFASSSVMTSHTATETVSVQQIAVESTYSEANDSKASHCESMQDKKNCCEQNSVCSQMGHDCTHCVSFIALMQYAQLKLGPHSYTVQNTYNKRLTGVKSLSADRPPCLI